MSVPSVGSASVPDWSNPPADNVGTDNKISRTTPPDAGTEPLMSTSQEVSSGIAASATAKKVEASIDASAMKAKISPTADPHTLRAQIMNQVNRDLGTKIDFNSVAKFEGGQQPTGYVPKDENGKALMQSGVTVATGCDLGQMGDNGDIKLKDLDLPQSLKDKLQPYVGLKRDAAVEKGPENLKLTQTEADQLDGAVHRAHLEAAKQYWDDHRGPDTPKFTDLSQEQQTVIFSRTFHQGITMPTKPAAQDFYQAAQKGDWAKAEQALRQYPVSDAWYKLRVTNEADLLKNERDAQQALDWVKKNLAGVIQDAMPSLGKKED